MTSVYSASDSISTSPRMSANRMPACAPGFRAEASQAEAGQLSLAQAAKAGGDTHRQIGSGQFQIGAASARAGVCAKIGLASAINEAGRVEQFTFHFECFSLYKIVRQ